MVRPVEVAMAWVAPTAAIMEVTPGSPASTGRPSAKRRRSARSSSADRYRSSGSLAIAFMITASSAAGTAGLAARGRTGVSRTCLEATATGESPVKGGLPTAIS